MFFGVERHHRPGVLRVVSCLRRKLFALFLQLVAQIHRVGSDNIGFERGSLEIYKQALKEGLIDIFMDAGAIVMNPNCSVCWGSCQGVIGENEVLISTGTRNFKGRAGHPSSKVYLGSAATVTTSAIAGKIALAEDIQ